MNCPHCQIAYDPDHWEACPHCGGNEEAQEPELELSGVLRTSTILIAVGEGVSEVYRSVEEVPEPLRRILVESTSGQNSGTIYIADQRGRERIAKALCNLPGTTAAPVFDRFSAALSSPAPGTRKARFPVSAIWMAFIIFTFAGAIVWLVGGRLW
jgi:hypothetical protein